MRRDVFKYLLAAFVVGAVMALPVALTQVVIEQRSLSSVGLPLSPGYGTALPTTANSGNPPVDGEEFTIRRPGTNRPRSFVYSDLNSQWIEKNLASYGTVREDFTFAKVAAHVEEDFTAAVVTDTGENMILLANSALGPIHYRLEAPDGPGLAATVDPFGNGSFSLDSLVDDADNEGVDLTFGGDRASLGYTFDEDSSFSMYCEARITIADISDTDSVYFGWFLTEAYQDAGAVNGHNTYAIFHIVDTAGDMDIETELNAGGTLADDAVTNWVDGATHTLRVTMAADSVSFTLDGLAVAQTNAVLNADNGDEFHCGAGSLNAAVGDPTVSFDYVEIGIVP